MSFYRIYGKWYHLEYSHYFGEVEEAHSPTDALHSFALHASDFDNEEEVNWDSEKPKEVDVGLLEPKASFWVGDDQMYQIRSIEKVKPSSTVCPECNGTGALNTYV